ncbi:hypothetical protein HFP15_10520 [Amycolatopsis sp. K13G38]|uniref:Uncharacterized protein n=1 Tax=Amycolatopsis acididurans TaxID=2724524 RepID=A0ABX1J4S4_9PSEU|nr:hypothetical protein [Amycolatopsis acididurans]NKQ53315.1 hypothetical protein [Amycolatopsis acididurans]
MTTALTPLATVPKLAAAVIRYVHATPAPEPVAVTLAPRDHEVSLQPRHSSDPVHTLGSLLVWTHRLTGVTGDWWHTASRDLHITLTGRGPHGITFRVYAGIPHRLVKRHVRLAPGARESVTPDEVYRLALTLRDEQDRRAVA